MERGPGCCPRLGPCGLAGADRDQMEGSPAPVSVRFVKTGDYARSRHTCSQAGRGFDSPQLHWGEVFFGFGGFGFAGGGGGAGTGAPTTARKNKAKKKLLIFSLLPCIERRRFCI